MYDFLKMIKYLERNARVLKRLYFVKSIGLTKGQFKGINQRKERLDNGKSRRSTIYENRQFNYLLNIISNYV
jgi:hypothetical protein